MFAVVFLFLARQVHGHGWVTDPPARNAQSGPKNGYCPHCGNGNGMCGDGNQWPSDSNYLNFYNGPVAQWTAGSVVPVTVKITAHHKGHFEFSLCNRVIDGSTQSPQACLDQHILERASAAEAGVSACQPNDKRPDCQPVDARHPERFYLPPGGFSPDGSNTFTYHLKVPADFSCSACTLQWRWWSANSCIPAPDYGCFASQLSSSGYDASSWGVSGPCPGGGAGRESGCGEEFRNCIDISVLPSAGGTLPPASTTTTTTRAATTTTTTLGASTTGGGAAGQECVSQEVLQCINDRSSFWPSCDPSQSKNVAGPNGYEFGYYCTQEWANALNEMLNDPAVNKCNDQEAIHRLLAQVAYETGYYSTVFQPIDGGAGLIHMIPGNWPVNARDMDSIFPGSDYESSVASMGENFFKTPQYGWKSVAAWFKRTNRVIGGCNKDLFDESFDEQTRCILSRVVDRSEAFNIVGACLAEAPPTTTAASTTMTTTTTTTTTSMATTAAPGVSCVAAVNAVGATNARCQAACELLTIGSWPCAGQLCDCTGTSSTTTTTIATTTPTTSRTTTSTTAAASGCVPNPNLPATIGTPSPEACKPCASGQTWWPCNPQQGYDLCICSSSLVQVGKLKLRSGAVLSP